VTDSRIVILGGGLAGMAAAWALAGAGEHQVTILEQGPRPGGLAGTFEQDGHFYPLSYHHILHRDHALLWFLDQLGLLPRVRWRRIRMLFHRDGRLYDLARPRDFLRFPMSFPDKLRFVRLMLRAFATRDWSDWLDRSAQDLVDAWGGPGVRTAMFEPLTRIKFDLTCAETSGAWLGARLHHREGSAPLGYVPGDNWTRLLCDGLARELEQRGVRVRVDTGVERLVTRGARVVAAALHGGEQVAGDRFVSTVPTEVYGRLVPADETPGLLAIRYTAVQSVVCATDQRIAPEFYWLSNFSDDRVLCGIFVLSSLNPTIGAPGETCVNLMTHLQSRHHEQFSWPDQRLLAEYHRRFAEIFGFDLRPKWTRILRIPMYSPVLVRGFRNPPVRSATWENLWFAGNWRTFPSILSTGTALWSGLVAARALLRERGQDSALAGAAESYRLRKMPRA
jgi:protoporphyrinogen oxidase